MPLIILILVIYLVLGTKKGKSILSDLLSKLAISSIKVIVYLLCIAFLIYVCISIIVWVFTHIFESIFILILAIALIVIIGEHEDKKQRQIHAEILEQWKNKPSKNFTDNEIHDILAPVSNNIYNSDTNTVKFKSDFPFGRITYFINFFEHDLQYEDPLYFSPIRSTNKDELREYGAVLTTAGLYISQQQENTTEDGNSVTKDIFIPFSGMISSKLSGNQITIYYVNYDDKKVLEQKYTTIPVQEINKICELVIFSGISKAIHEQTVYSYTAILDEKESEFLKNNAANGYEKGFVAAGVAASIPNMNQVFNEVKYNMNQRQGHGAAAEYANTAYDRFTGDFRAQHLGGDNVKNGADRTTHRLFSDEVLIQSKYCKTPKDTIDAAFFDSKHDYPSNMKIEVPRDQYQECLEYLQERIDKGDLKDKGIMPGDKAEKRVCPGKVTYEQAFNITNAGSIDGLKIDVMQGITCSALAGSITAAITFATCKWHGMNSKDAALKSLEAGVKTVGKSTAIFVVTMQLSRKNMINIFAKFGKNSQNATITNPLFKVGDSLAKKVNGAITKSGLGLKTVTAQNVISGSVVAVVTFGPDIARALVGRISFKQLMKNSAIGASGLVGASIGQTIIPVPVVGAMIGGAITSFVAKKALDLFVEDDAIEMFAILKEEFIDVVTMSGLNSDEFNEVVNMTLSHKKLSSLLRDMYAYGDSRQYAHYNIVSEAVQYVFSKRERITDDMYNDAMIQLAADSNA